jgi:hypothetical protein
MHRLIPDSALAVVDGAGHLPNLERPAAFDQALLAFLRDLPQNANSRPEALDPASPA